MKHLVLCLIVFCGFFGRAQQIDLISLQELSEIIESPGPRLKVINFWASWCRPCIMEMPYFDAIDRNKAEVYFISVDHPEDLEKAQRMIQKVGVKSKIYLLNEIDADKYITAISEDWTGAIPATLFVDSRGRQNFFEQAFDKPELENYVKKYSAFNK